MLHTLNRKITISLMRFTALCRKRQNKSCSTHDAHLFDPKQTDSFGRQLQHDVKQKKLLAAYLELRVASLNAVAQMIYLHEQILSWPDPSRIELICFTYGKLEKTTVVSITCLILNSSYLLSLSNIIFLSLYTQNALVITKCFSIFLFRWVSTKKRITWLDGRTETLQT